MAFLELWQEAWGSSQHATGTSRTSHVASVKSGLLSTCQGHSGFLSSHFRGIRPHLILRDESCGVSRDAAGSFGFLLSCDRDLREPLIFASGKSGLLSCCDGTPRDSSRVAAGE